MKLKSYTNKDRYGNMTSFEFYEGASVDMGDVPPMMQGIPDHPGDPKGTDTVPAWLTPGEFVMNAEATRMFEPQIEQMNNAGRAVQAQQGGTIPEYAAHGKPIYAAAGGNSGFLANILKRLEGVKSEAYLDSAGKATIGAGSTRGVQMGDTASDDQVDSMLAEDIAVVDQDYGQLVSADLNTNQEAAVKSLLFNIGGPQFANSKARAALNAGDFERFKKEAAEFRKVGDKVIPGLENRRAQELALFDSPVGQDPWGINKRQVSTRDDRVANLIAAGQPTDLAMQAAILGQDAETTGEIVTPPPVDRGPPSVMSMISGEEQNAFQRDVEAAQKADPYTPTGDLSDPFAPESPLPGPDEEMLAAQKATSKKGMYDPGGNMEAIQAGIDQAQILEDQRRMQQGQVPSMTEVNVPLPDELVGPEMNNVDDRGALQKFGESGGLMGALSRGTDSLNEIKEKFQKENIEQNRVNRVLLEQDRMQQGQVPEIKESPKVSTSFDDKTNLPPGFILNEKTGKVERAPSNLPLSSAIAKESDQAKLTQLESAKERRQSIIDNGGGPGDPIFDQEQAYIEKLEKAIPGTKEKVDALTDKTTKVFTDGELEVTDAAIEKKTIQAEKLVDLGLSDAAKKVEQEVKDLKAKKERLETQSKDLTVPPIGEPPKSDPSPFAKGGEDTPITDLTKTVTPEEVVKNTDGSSVPKGTTPEDATKAGGGAPPEQVNKAESFLSGIFGDLFDKGELKRMAIMYVGGRMLGGSHSGSLNFAAKQYVKRVDSKASEHKKYVKELTKDGSYTPKSIALYNKTKNIADLEKKGASYAPTGGAPITKMVPQFNKEGQVTGYKKATLVPVKNSITGGTHYQSRSGAVMHPAQVSSLNDYREELDDNTEAYKQRRSRILGDMKGYFEEIRDSSPDNYTEDGGKRTYRVGVGPERAALAYYDWAKRQGVDPDSTAGRKVMTQAYETMVAEAAGKDIRYTPNDFTRFLEDQQLRETTGAPELFIINEDAVMNKKETPKYVQADKMSLLYQNLDTVISGIPNSSTDRGDIIGVAIQKWNKLDSSEEGRTLRKKYNDSAEKSAGESGFYKYMMDTAQALHAELNKPKE